MIMIEILKKQKKNLKNFGLRIQELRKKNNLTQSELAEKLGNNKL